MGLVKAEGRQALCPPPHLTADVMSQLARTYSYVKLATLLLTPMSESQPDAASKYLFEVLANEGT